MSRVGNFTSSEIWKLTKLAKNGVDFGEKALTYIEEKRFEKKLNRSLNIERFSRPTSWGNLCEIMAYNKIPDFDYSLISKKRYIHDIYSNWNGCPDLLKTLTVGDIKCPYTLKAFCQLIKWCSSGYDSFKLNCPEYFWQLISNAILTNSKFIELFVFCPMEEDIEYIKYMASNSNSDNNNYFWIYSANIQELPYLTNTTNYKSLNNFLFEVKEEDKQFLTTQVQKAILLLNK